MIHLTKANGASLSIDEDAIIVIESYDYKKTVGGDRNVNCKIVLHNGASYLVKERSNEVDKLVEEAQKASWNMEWRGDDDA